MNADVLSNCLEQAIPIVREAGKLLHDRVRSSSIQEKGKTDFVTAVDTAVQYFIRERLQKLDSSIQFMGEEQDNSSVEPDRLTWILDPVDGTTNLIHGFRHSAISLALAEGEQVLFGVVYDPFSEELFTAQRGHGAFCNHKPIHVSADAFGQPLFCRDKSRKQGSSRCRLSENAGNLRLLSRHPPYRCRIH